MNTENNKLIALFNGDIKSINDKVSFNKNCSVNELKYDTDWNWLMVVVEKIESMNYYVDIMNKAVSINNDEDMIVDLSGKDFSTKIEAVYTAVLEFIKWYNQTQNTNS
jgi:hypothetical protein